MCTQKENSCYYLNLIHIPEHELTRVLFGWYKMYVLTLGMLQFEPFIQVYHSSLFEKYSKVHFKYNLH